MAKKKIAKKKPSAAEPSELTFEAALAELEQAVTDLESGELGLDESLQRYEQGVARLEQCQQRLAAAEQRIELLSGVDAEGNPVTRPLDDAEEAPSRSAKRSAGRGRGVDDGSRLF
ncbi:Exodeoxyribonuclease 7 small subunit [Posidoniimonas polymericola]|uniref:Exodeoxyribonuclease 7 small subunit n=1 Tax=Posidoniimonas polymericola TaxID=2528002 RepID=A0A5C5YSQ7_9BACT|nr:Exodeoxyribonuclease 7 small subunit [Posidoniimonas polymericola]